MEDIMELIKKDKMNKEKDKAIQGLNYYKGKHDILNYRLFYYDSNGQLQEDRFRSNIKIEHRFHTELVDQKVQYLLSNPIEIEAEDERLNEYLDEYINEDFQELIQELLHGASCKGKEYLYCYLDEEGKLQFQVADSLGIIEDYEDYKLKRIIRYYDVKKDDKKITKVEVWDEKTVTYYEIEGQSITLDPTEDINPRPHIVTEDHQNIYDGGGLGFIPFFKLLNNQYGSTDLEPIKSLIDDYDLMAASLSNNLQDFQDAIYVVKGYQGDNLDTLTTNLKTRKTVGTSEDGDIDIKTIDIPYEARKVKLELDKEMIYKFGMGFDSTQLGDGNITNVVIKSRYSLLDLKCNKAETRLRRVLRDVIKVIIDNINERHGTSYSHDEVEFTITREVMVNENDNYLNEKVEEERKGVEIDNILKASVRLSEETVLERLCEILEIDIEEEKAREIEDRPSAVGRYDLDV